MTDKPDTPGSASADGVGRPVSGEQPVIIRDKRKIDSTGRQRAATGAASTTGSGPAEADRSPGGTPQGADAMADGVDDVLGNTSAAAEAVAVAGEVVTDESLTSIEREYVEGELIGAELAALRAGLDERTRDVQRVSAEYANYRKRVDRDRGLVVEQATGHVLASLLPVLDDLDRAREHGDLVGPFSSVAEQLTAALSKFGLSGFGEKGDPFDPTRHEAVAHLTSGEVTEPTCVDVMRRGYLINDRLLRPALVAVADPQ